MVDSRAYPESIDTERVVLGSILTDESLMHSCRMVLDNDDFVLERHRKFWACACELYDSGAQVDRVTIAQTLQTKGQLANDDLSYMLSLDEGLPRIPALDNYAKFLKDKSALRKIIAAADNIQKRCYSGTEKPHEILDSMGRLALDISAAQEPRRGLVSAKELVDSVGITQILSPRKERGIMGPWAWLNNSTCGFLPGELWILAGHTGTGKTSAAVQYGVHVARKGLSVPIFSLEMGKTELFQRATFQISRVDSEKAKRGALSSGELAQLNDAANALYDIPLYFDDSGASTVMAIHAALRRLRARGPIGMVIVDYLQLLGGGGRNETRAQEVGSNARALKVLATEFQCPVVLLSQFSRESAKPGAKGEGLRRPELYDLKESGDIENHANGVWFIHRPSPLDMDLVPVEFILAKQRDGRKNIYREHYFLPKCQRFDEKEAFYDEN